MSAKKLTLSFDNGPDPECTPLVLDVLAARNIKATFFVCGQGNTRNPAMQAGSEIGLKLLHRVKGEGHWIGNHSLSHTVELGTSRDPAIVEREIGLNEEIIGPFNHSRLFRPYMGGGIRSKRVFSPEAVDYLCRHNYTVVLFNCLPRDWESPDDWPELAFEQMKTIKWPLVIVHDVAKYRGMAQLERFLDQALEEGYQFTQEFPLECTPIVAGKIIGSLEGLVCGEQAEPLRVLEK
jgi:peptidoglycan-N-acetylglucosamine deacetylase